MGYSTDFDGEFGLDRPLAPAHRLYLLKFAGTRRMQRMTRADWAERNPDLAINAAGCACDDVEDALRVAVGLPVGIEGGYFVGGEGFHGQQEDSSVMDYNRPPAGQPGLWCQWVPNEEGTALGWDGGEKFYNYIDWLHYLIVHFLSRWDYRLNGQVEWHGEDSGDLGKITVQNNQVRVQRARIEWGEWLTYNADSMRRPKP